MDMLSPIHIVYLSFFLLLVIASIIDAKYYLLPDIITIGGGLLAMPLAIMVLGLTWADTLGGACLGAGSFWLIKILYRHVRKKEGLGTGDIKFMFFIGAMCGWQALPSIVWLASSCALCAAGLVYLMQRFQKKSSFGQIYLPFGPFLSLGAIVYILSL